MELARVLLVDDDDASRLTLKVVLEAGGYGVSAASSAAEAVEKIDGQQYDLVLCDLHLESTGIGMDILAHARSKCYKPATALVTSEQHGDADPTRPMLIKPEAVPELLGEVADLISSRAARIVEQGLKAARLKSGA